MKLRMGTLPEAVGVELLLDRLGLNGTVTSWPMSVKGTCQACMHVECKFHIVPNRLYVLFATGR